jgi:hypothetical protein
VEQHNTLEQHKLFRRSEFEGYGDSLKTLLEQQNYSEDHNLKGFVIHSKPCIVKILKFTVDFNNKKFYNLYPYLYLIKIQKKKKKFHTYLKPLLLLAYVTTKFHLRV